MQKFSKALKIGSISFDLSSVSQYNANFTAIYRFLCVSDLTSYRAQPTSCLDPLSDMVSNSADVISRSTN